MWMNACFECQWWSCSLEDRLLSGNLSRYSKRRQAVWECFLLVMDKIRLRNTIPFGGTHSSRSLLQFALNTKGQLSNNDEFSGSSFSGFKRFSFDYIFSVCRDRLQMRCNHAFQAQGCSPLSKVSLITAVPCICWQHRGQMRYRFCKFLRCFPAQCELVKLKSDFSWQYSDAYKKYEVIEGCDFHKKNSKKHRLT